jgi:hypothetical protein
MMFLTRPLFILPSLYTSHLQHPFPSTALIVTFRRRVTAELGKEAVALGFNWQVGRLAALQQPSLSHGTPQRKTRADWNPDASIQATEARQQKQRQQKQRQDKEAGRWHAEEQGHCNGKEKTRDRMHKTALSEESAARATFFRQKQPTWMQDFLTHILYVDQGQGMGLPNARLAYETQSLAN